MVKAASSNIDLAAQVGEYTISRTTPTTIQRHDISDEQLDMLTDNQREFSRDVLTIAIGTFAGSLVPAISAVAELQKTGSTFGNWELVECLICFAALVVSIITAVMQVNKPDNREALKCKIREQGNISWLETS